MNEPVLSRDLGFVAAQRGLDETTVLVLSSFLCEI